jgi:MFS family permease
MDRCGRKLALQIASLPLIVGWILIGLAPNHGVLLLGRLVAGLSAGLTAAAGQVRVLQRRDKFYLNVASWLDSANHFNRRFSFTTILRY